MRTVIASFLLFLIYVVVLIVFGSMNGWIAILAVLPAVPPLGEALNTHFDNKRDPFL